MGINIHMTLQDVAEKVNNHLKEQNSQCIGDFIDVDGNQATGCIYHNKVDGKKCAVGCLITDKFHRHSFDGRGASHNDVSNAVQYSINSKSIIPIDLMEMLDAMQDVHDIGMSDGRGYTSRIERKMKEIFENYGLEFK